MGDNYHDGLGVIELNVPIIKLTQMCERHGCALDWSWDDTAIPTKSLSRRMRMDYLSRWGKQTIFLRGRHRRSLRMIHFASRGTDCSIVATHPAPSSSLRNSTQSQSSR